LLKYAVSPQYCYWVLVCSSVLNWFEGISEFKSDHADGGLS